MKYWILFFFFFISFFINGQTKLDSTFYYFDLKKFDKSLNYGLKTFNHNSLIKIGMQLLEQKEYNNALNFLNNGYKLGENYLSYNDEILLKISIGACHLYNSNFKDAIINFENAIESQENSSDTLSQDYIKSLNYLAYAHQLDTNFSKSKTILIKALEIGKKTLAENNIEYLTTLKYLGDLYYEIGEYKSAEITYLKLFVISKKISNKEDFNFVELHRKLGAFYSTVGQINKAEEYYLKALKQSEEVYKKNSVEYAESSMSIGFLYLNLNKYNLAESFFLEALKIRREIFGERNEFFISTLTSLAYLYQREKKYERAEGMYLKASKITADIFGENHVNYAYTLEDIAGLYEEMGFYNNSKELYIRALKIIENIQSKNSQDYFDLKLKLAKCYNNIGDLTNSETIHVELLKNQNEILGVNHPDNAYLLFSIGSDYFINRNYTLAEKYFLKSLKMYKDIYGEEHRLYLANLSILANLYRITLSYENAANYFTKHLKLNYNNILSDIYGLTESEMIFYSNDNINKIVMSSLYTFLEKESMTYPIINIEVYNYELIIRNISLKNKDFLKKIIQKSNNSILKEKYNKYLLNKSKEIEINQLPIYLRPSDFENLIKETEQIEKEIFKQSISLKNFKNNISKKWIDVKDNLQKSEISIDIVNYNSTGKQKKYSGLIIKKDSKYPKFIPLFEEKQLALLLGKDKNQQDSIRIDKQYLNKQLSELILKPLENELKGISTIYLSLSGLTHQINVAALPINENQTFGEKYKIHILNSPSELMDYTAITFDKKDKFDFILYGNIDYDKRNIISNKDSVYNDDFVNVDEEIKGLQTRSGISNFGYLSGTKNEIENISTLANKSNLKTIIFEDRNATEESIKQLDGRTTPFILHLATHGFFFPDPEIEMSNEFLIEGKSKVFKTSDNPMMRSGLVFSGANKSWGKVNDNQSGDDGILTASEISNLDLSACELVVLSACETGLGEVKGSEGVFGLQRAFKMAGVENIIMSLWKVPDTQTAELFDIFYSECFAGKTIHEAFHSAQAKMKAKYSPYYWAGFVLLE